MNGDRWIAGTRLGAQGHGAAGRTEGLDVKQGSEFRGLRVADLTGHGRTCTKPSFEKDRLALGSVSIRGLFRASIFELSTYLPLRVVFAAKKTGKMPVCPTDKLSVLLFCHASDRDHRRNFHRENDFCKLPA